MPDKRKANCDAVSIGPGPLGVNRRRFISTAATGVLAPYVIPSHVLASPGKPGANDRVRLGVIGTGNRAAALVAEWCDPKLA